MKIVRAEQSWVARRCPGSSLPQANSSKPIPHGRSPANRVQCVRPAGALTPRQECECCQPETYPSTWSNPRGAVLQHCGGDVWVIERPFVWLGIDVGGRATVVRLGNGELWVHSPLELDDALQQELAQLGPVKHIVSPNFEHTKYAAQWIAAYPDARAFACPGLADKEPDVGYTDTVGVDALAPPEWLGEIEVTWIDCERVLGKPFFNEVVFFHRPSAALISADFVWNWADQGIPLQTTAFKMGMDKLFLPFYKSVMVTDKTAFATALGRIQNWAFTSIIPSHGDIVADDPDAGRMLQRFYGDLIEGDASDDDDPASTSSLLSVFCPILKAFSSYDPASPPPRWAEVTASGLASITRLAYGKNCSVAAQPRPPAPLQLFEFEACPFCRRVREAVTDLGLAVQVFPCPKGSVHHRAQVLELGGREQFPFLLDENTGTSLYESDAIVEYLYREYGQGAAVPEGFLKSTLLTGWMPTLLRIGRGMVRSQCAGDPPPQMLVLYDYENNQFSRLVRETLCELELPHEVLSAGMGSANREALGELREDGATSVPYLVDPNTGTAMADSEAIQAYLYQQYSTCSTPAG